MRVLVVEDEVHLAQAIADGLSAEGFDVDLVGLNLHDANELANRCGCHLRLAPRDRKGVTVTADLDARRINIKSSA